MWLNTFAMCLRGAYLLMGCDAGWTRSVPRCGRQHSVRSRRPLQRAHQPPRRRSKSTLCVRPCKMLQRALGCRGRRWQHCRHSWQSRASMSLSWKHSWLRHVPSLLQQAQQARFGAVARRRPPLHRPPVPPPPPAHHRQLQLAPDQAAAAAPPLRPLLRLRTCYRQAAPRCGSWLP